MRWHNVPSQKLMSHFKALMKMNIKLLLRNKVFLFFLFVLPVVAVCMLNMNFSSDMGSGSPDYEIIELKSAKDRAVYVAETEKYKVKVLDNSGSELSEYLLESLAKMGVFSICRYQAEEYSQEEALAQAKEDGYHDRVEAVLYLSENYDKAIQTGNWEEAMAIYYVSEDARIQLWEASLIQLLTTSQTVAVKADGDKELLNKLLAQLPAITPIEAASTQDDSDELITDKELRGCSDRMGYSFALLTLEFAFCGVCIAYTVIEEQQNKVYTRMLLTKVSKLEYLLSKLLMALGISCMQTVVLAVSMVLLVKQDFGMSFSNYLLIVFLLGTVFNIISLIVGVLIGEIMGANYAVFAIWCISALASGMYFPLNDDNVAIRTFSYLMPQRWFLRASEMIMIEDKSAYLMLLYITAAYFIVFLSIGVVGLRMKRVD